MIMSWMTCMIILKVIIKNILICVFLILLAYGNIYEYSFVYHERDWENKLLYCNMAY